MKKTTISPVLLSAFPEKARPFVAELTIFSLLLFSLNLFGHPFATLKPLPVQKVQNSVIATAYIPFIQNIGQVDSNVNFYANLLSGTAFIEKDGTMTYNFRTGENSKHVIKERLISAHELQPQGTELSPAIISSFIGPQENWKTNIPNYKTVKIGKPYAGITLHLLATNGFIEKIFTVNPEGSPSDIHIEIDGAEKLTIGESGEMHIQNRGDSLSMSAPTAYQETPDGRKNIVVNYRLINTSSYGFDVAAYDQSIPLIIDPVLASTYIGGTGIDGSNEVSILTDSSGKVFVTGDTRSSDFPTTTGAYDETYNTGFDDSVIARFSSDLSTLEAATFIGGTQSDQINAMAIDGSDNIYITGITSSIDYPTTVGAYDETYNFSADVFVSKLSNDLTTLSASTYLGFNSFDVAYDIGIAPTIPEKVLITGSTQSSGFPTTGSVFDSTFGGAQDAFISKFDLSLATLEASTFVGGNTSIGGPNTERGMEVAGDASGNIYVGGYTNENDLPTTIGAYDGTFNLVDGFFGKFDSNLSSTGAVLSYFGGTGSDFIEDIEITASGVYMSGLTTSSDFPTTAGAYSETINSTDGFVSRFSTDLSTLQVSTFVGQSGFDTARAMAIDSSGNVYITGDSDSLVFPGSTCVNTNSGGLDGVIVALSPDLSTLNGAAMIGGTGTDIPQDITIDGSDNVFIAGSTTSSDYVTTTGAYNETYSGTTDMFLTKISTDLTYQGADQFCGSQTISSSTLTFQNIPDTFNFGTITEGSAQNLFNNNTPPDANKPGADDLLEILDDRNSGGFVVTVDPDGTFIEETSTYTIPLSDLSIVTSLDETDPGNVGGITYGAGFIGDQSISAPLYVDVDSVSLTTTGTYTTNFGSAPIVLMDGTLASASGRDGTMALFTSFYLNIDPNQEAGSYALKLTYTLTDSTT